MSGKFGVLAKLILERVPLTSECLKVMCRNYGRTSDKSLHRQTERYAYKINDNVKLPRRKQKSLVFVSF